MVVPVAPQAGTGSADRILPDLGGIVPARWTDCSLRSQCPGSTGNVLRDWYRAGATGFGTALILAIVSQMRDRDERTPAAASAEVRALQSRMNPHFLFNALNTLAALADDRTARNSPCGRMVASNS
jgi:hypothetical protein